ncbi:MAG TPA: DUF3307 domain-containing protein [Prosthecobacter sp.]
MSGLLPFPTHTWLDAIQVIFLLCAGHALMDYPLQGEFLSTCKNRHLLRERNDPTRPVHIWPICMTAHCLLHAVAVWAVTGCFILCVIEFVLHWIIDAAKCENWTTFTQDQLLHVICKIAYVIAAMLV